MREGKVAAAAEDVDRRPQSAQSDGGALDVPAGPAGAER